VMIEARLAPHVLVIAVVTKKLAISDKVCPRPVFCVHRHDRIKKGQVRDERTASWAVYLSTQYTMFQHGVSELTNYHTDYYLKSITSNVLNRY